MNKGKYQLFKSEKDNQFYWRLRASNQEIILQSEGYQTKQGAEAGIESVRENSPFDDRYQRLDAKNGQFYFVLKALNGKVIGVSETYITKAAREKGIAAVKREGPGAPVEDLTQKAGQLKEEAKAVGIAEASGGLFISPKASGPHKGMPVKPKGGVYGEERYV
ncbi:MAG: YegP family protein [Lewinellaceae bacterium]|nr:YegP family protein [Lewinellaceae bacterium]